MPLIAIDASSANKPAKTGVEWYAFRLIEAMKKHPLREGERVVLFSPTPLEGELSALPAGWESKVLAWPGRGWMAARVSWECLVERPDALFVPAQGFPAVAGKAKLAGVLHDVEFLLQPGLYRPGDRARLKRAYSSLARRASRLLAVSEYAKRTACEAYGIAPERVSVTPLAPALPDPLVPQPMHDPLILPLGKGEVTSRTPYFLVLGRVETKKGADLAVRAFEAFKAMRPAGDPYDLRFIGGDGFGAEDVRALASASPHAAKIRFEGHAIDEAAARALAGASALLALSRAEGFGIAPLEAMRSGVPVIASDIPPFREVGADAPAFVRADDAGAVAKAMAEVASDDPARARLVQAGKARAAAFSWDETARLTWEALRNMLR